MTMGSQTRKEFAVSLKTKLDVLKCLYTEDLNEDVIADLVLSVGEGRLQILQWLMLEFYPKLATILDLTQDTVKQKPKSKLQRIANSANVLLLCSCEDLPLVRGEGPLYKQVAFVERLVDMVLSQSQESSLSSIQCCSYIDQLVRQEGCLDLVPESDFLHIPKDIRTEMDQLSKESSQTPDLKQLIKQAQELSVELDQKSKALPLAQKDSSLPTKVHQTEVAEMSLLLGVTLQELGQLVSGFTLCFESHIGKWCNKPEPELNSLGPTFKRVDTALTQFIKVLDEVHKIRQTKGDIEKNIKDKTTRNHVSAHRNNATVCFEECLGVLEEALYRVEAKFQSQYKPLLHL